FGAAVSGLVANACGLSDSMTAAAVLRAAFWVPAALVVAPLAAVAIGTRLNALAWRAAPEHGRPAAICSPDKGGGVPDDSRNYSAQRQIGPAPAKLNNQHLPSGADNARAKPLSGCTIATAIARLCTNCREAVRALQQLGRFVRHLMASQQTVPANTYRSRCPADRHLFTSLPAPSVLRGAHLRPYHRCAGPCFRQTRTTRRCRRAAHRR